VYPGKRRIEFLHHVAEGGRQRGSPADQYVVMAGRQLTAAAGCRRQSHDLPQSAAHAVTFHGVAHLL
jgi:hypothetical protein